MITKDKYDEMVNMLAKNLFTWQEVTEFCYLTTLMLDEETLEKFDKEIVGDDNV